MRYTYNCTSCGAVARTTRAVDLLNRSGRRCPSCKESAHPGDRDDAGDIRTPADVSQTGRGTQ